MSKIVELIRQFCPSGVEFKELGEVANITIGEFVHKNKQDINAKYPVYNGGISYTGFYEEFNNTANKIVISARGANAGFINKVIVDYWAGNSCYSISLKENYSIDWIFVYYYLKLNENKLIGDQQKGGIPAVSKKMVEKFQIPIPPLPIQQEIVSILDKFTELETALEAELEARKKQYEYYRNELLNFEGKEVEWKTLGEVAKCYSGATPSTGVTKYWENGTIPWMSSGEVNKGKVFDTEKKITQLGYDNCSTKMVPPNTVVIALAGQGKTRGTVAITRMSLCTNQSLCSVIVEDDNANSDFVFYFLKTQYQQLRSVSSGDGTRGGLNLQMIKGYKIPIPPLAEQERIVGILDKFDTLVNDITLGLPAEIAARRKQYEYYRGRLLDFNALTSSTDKGVEIAPL